MDNAGSVAPRRFKFTLKPHRHGPTCECVHSATPRRDTKPAPARSSALAALLPMLACAVCPACLSTYAKIFSALGAGAVLSERQHGAVLAVAVFTSVVVSAWRAHRFGRRWPLVATLAGCTLVTAGHLTEVAGIEWLGVLMLLGSGLVEHLVVRRRARRTATLVEG